MHQIWVHRLAWLMRACLCMLWVSASTFALADPPTRAGRIVDVAGTAWSFDADHNEWGRVIRNQTLAEGDRLRVDPKSRVSMRIGSTSLWLDGGADLEVVQLDDARVLLRLEKGALGLALRTSDSVSEYRVQTREGQLFPDDLGIYRIEQLPQGTRAQALQGRLRFESDRSGAMQRAWLREGEQAEFWWADGPRTEHQALLRDGFANWLLSQAGATPTGTVSEEYVSSEMTGVEELDRNGRWEQAPEYGNVWIPTQVAPGWEPYRDGRWVWTRNWGWSWVDDMPWGFAPFHYGRWVVWRGRWCWTPGHYVSRPVYAPALVTWRQAPGIAIGVTIRQPPSRGSWHPLPPREAYVPNYRHSDDYRNRLNRPYEGRPGADMPRNPVGPQRESPREYPREFPRDNFRGNLNDNPREARPWNDSPREQPRRPDVVAPPVRNVVNPVAPTQVVPPQVQAPSPAPARAEPPGFSSGQSRGRDRERDSGSERYREQAPVTSVAPPAPVPVAPVMRQPPPAVQPPPSMPPPSVQRPPQPQPDAGDKENSRKRYGRDKNGPDVER